MTDADRALLDNLALETFWEQDASKLKGIVPWTNMKMHKFVEKYMHAINVTIYAAKDADVLHFIKQNRNVTESWVKDLIHAINKDWIQPNISFINEEGWIKDGQHRAVVSKIMSETQEQIFPMFMIIVPTQSSTDVAALNAAKQTWKRKDSLHLHAQSDFPAVASNYKRMIKFCQDLQVTDPLVTTYIIESKWYTRQDIAIGEAKFSEQDYKILAEKVNNTRYVLEQLGAPEWKWFAHTFQVLGMMKYVHNFNYDQLVSNIEKATKIVHGFVKNGLWSAETVYWGLAEIHNFNMKSKENVIPYSYKDAKKEANTNRLPNAK